MVETKTSSKYFFGYLDKVIRSLVLVLHKMSGYVKTFKVKNGDWEKNYKLMSLHMGDEKLLEKYKTIWTEIEDLKNIELNALPVYDDRHIKTKIRTYREKVYTNFHDLNVLEYDVEFESFTVLILYLFTITNIISKYI